MLPSAPPQLSSPTTIPAENLRTSTSGGHVFSRLLTSWLYVTLDDHHHLECSASVWYFLIYKYYGSGRIYPPVIRRPFPDWGLEKKTCLLAREDRPCREWRQCSQCFTKHIVANTQRNCSAHLVGVVVALEHKKASSSFTHFPFLHIGAQWTGWLTRRISSRQRRHCNLDKQFEAVLSTTMTAWGKEAKRAFQLTSKPVPLRSRAQWSWARCQPTFRGRFQKAVQQPEAGGDQTTEAREIDGDLSLCKVRVSLKQKLVAKYVLTMRRMSSQPVKPTK